MLENTNIKESVKKLLFEQHKSAVSSFDSAQDSLDKAFTAILFAEIAFYISKMKPIEEHVLFHAGIVGYMAFALLLVFYSFMKSKTTLTIYMHMTESQIFALDEEEPITQANLLVKIQQDEKRFNASNRILVHVNRQIPGMVLTSSGFCFMLVCTTNYQLMRGISLLLCGGSLIIFSVVIFITFFKDDDYVKKT